MMVVTTLRPPLGPEYRFWTTDESQGAGAELAVAVVCALVSFGRQADVIAVERGRGRRVKWPVGVAR
jgi:hypothetical protein